MRIICDQCQTKYIVPDEKIVKNVLRLTCQKCGHVITTRVEEAAPDDSTLSKWRTSDIKTPKRSTQETPAWYYSYNGESFGPFTQAELKSCFIDGEAQRIAEECYVWHRDLVDWKLATEVEPFAKAILSPPPPPPPPPLIPAPRAANAHLPPLLGQSMSAASGRSSLGGAGARDLSQAIASPRAMSLKERLVRAPSGVGEFSASDIADASRQMTPHSSRGQARFAGDSRPSFVHAPQSVGLSPSGEKPQPLDDEVPTQEKMAAIHWVDSDTSTDAAALSHDLEVASSDETTQVGVLSPFLSFQSLDVISPDIRAQGSLETPSQALKKPYPTISSLPAVGAKLKHAFEPRPATQPKISSLFEKPVAESVKPQNAAVRSLAPAPVAGSAGAISSSLLSNENDNGNRVINLGGVPRFPGLKKASSAGLDNESKPMFKPGEEDIDFADHKEDFASITGPDTPYSITPLDPMQRHLSQDDSVSSWLPSQTNLASESGFEHISLDDVSLASDLLGLASPSEVSSDSFSLEDSAEHSSLGVHKEDASLPSIDMDHSAVDLEVVSLSDELPVVGVGGALNAALDLDSAKVEGLDSGQSDLEGFQSELLESSSFQIDNADGMNALFADAAESGSSRARVSRSQLDDIQKKHSALFAELVSEQSSEAMDSSVSENSMLIQLKHLQRVHQKDKRRSTFLVVLVLVTLFLAVGLGVFFGNIVLEGGNRVPSEVQGYEHVTGRSISRDELDLMAPEDDFAFVLPSQEDKVKPKSNERLAVGAASAASDATAEAIRNVKEASRRPSRSDKSKEQLNGKVDADAANETAKQAAADSANVNDTALVALYGLPQNNDSSAGIPSGKRADGRTSVVLGKVEDFARTDSVLGSKYTNLAQTGMSERDRFNLGLRSVSQTVQECQRREAKTGSLQLPKVYLRITVEPSGSVNEFEIEEKGVSESFYKCLDGKKDRWKFAPFQGEAVKLRQGFILS